MRLGQELMRDFRKATQVKGEPRLLDMKQFERLRSLRKILGHLRVGGVLKIVPCDASRMAARNHAERVVSIGGECGQIVAAVDVNHVDLAAEGGKVEALGIAE